MALSRKVALLGQRYCPEALAIFRACTTQPTPFRKFLINRLIVSLKSAGVWSILDVLYVLAAANSQAALINWKSPGTFNGTVNGSPTFTADRGFTGTQSSTTQWGDTGFNPSTAGGSFTQNSAHLSVWSLTSLGGEACIGLADTGYKSQIFPRDTSPDDFQYFRINSGGSGGFSVPNADGSGFYVANRSSSSAIQGYKDTSVAGTATDTSAALANRNIFFLGFNNAGTVTGSNMQLAALTIGGSLDATAEANLRNALFGYLHDGTVGAA